MHHHLRFNQIKKNNERSHSFHINNTFLKNPNFQTSELRTRRTHARTHQSAITPSVSPPRYTSVRFFIYRGRKKISLSSITIFGVLMRLLAGKPQFRRLTFASPHLTCPRTNLTHHADLPRTAAGAFLTPGVVRNGRSPRITFPTDRQSTTAALCPTFTSRPSYLYHHHHHYHRCLRHRRRHRHSCCHSPLPPFLLPLNPSTILDSFLLQIYLVFIILGFYAIPAFVYLLFRIFSLFRHLNFFFFSVRPSRPPPTFQCYLQPKGNLQLFVFAANYCCPLVIINEEQVFLCISSPVHVISSLHSVRT